MSCLPLTKAVNLWFGLESTYLVVDDCSRNFTVMLARIVVHPKLLPSFFVILVFSCLIKIMFLVETVETTDTAVFLAHQ